MIRGLLVMVVLIAMGVDAKQCKPKHVSGHAAFIVDHDVGVSYTESDLAGTCPCTKSSGSWSRGFYAPEATTDVSQIVQPTIEANCTDMSQVCLVGTNKKGYKAFGTLTSINLYSYCVKPNKCKMYVKPVCAVPGDTASGLQGGGKKLSCAKAARKNTIGRGSKFFKVAAISCSGCKGNLIKKAKCKLPYTASSANGTVTASTVPFDPTAPTTPGCSTVSVAGTSDIVVDDDVIINSQQAQAYSCPCGSGGDRVMYSSVPGTNPSTEAPSMNFQCPDMTTMVVIAENGNCFFRFGTLLTSINLHARCDNAADASTCHTYATPVCSNPSSNTEGLTNEDGSVHHLCNEPSSGPALTTASILIKAVSVGCGGCEQAIHIAPCDA